jgi:hypothetical protein
MEAEISLLMANQALVSRFRLVVPIDRGSAFIQAAPGKLIYDPFVSAQVYIWQLLAAHA